MTLQATRDLLEDERVWSVAAIVVLLPGQQDHYKVLDSGQVMVSVATIRHGVVMDVVLKGGDRDGTGVWIIPAVGTEVLIAFDSGEWEGDPYIAGFHGRAPSGLAPNKVLVIGSNVEIRSKTGTASAVPTMADFEALRTYVSNQFKATGGHTHVVSGAATTSIAASTGAAGTPPTTAPAAPAGTQIAKLE